MKSIDMAHTANVPGATGDCGDICRRDSESTANAGSWSQPAGEVAPQHLAGNSLNPAEIERGRLFGLVELILKNRGVLHRIIREPSLHSVLIPRLLAISLIGFAFYGLAMSVVLSAAGVWPELTPIAVWLDAPPQSLITFTTNESGSGFVANLVDGSALTLIAAYAIGLIAATGICLPSLYFYGLLSGVRMSMIDVVVHALKSKAVSAVALTGILPIYAAVAMGVAIFNVGPAWLHLSLLLGLVLPFIAGLWGTRSLYVGFTGLCDTMPAERRARRHCFLRRLLFSWVVVYTAISPVMIFTLWQTLGG